MFALRIIENSRKDEESSFEQVVENFGLGNSYALLKKGETKEFDEEMATYHPEEKTGGIRALLCADNGLHFFIREETSTERQEYFIMTESGKTFE